MNIFIFFLLSNINSTMWEQILTVSENRDGDNYDYLGRNISAQYRREELGLWKTVTRKRR